MKNITFLLIAMFAITANAQRTCGVEAKMQQIMNDPAAKSAYLARQARFEEELEKLNNRTYRSAAEVTTTIRIPVAVHYPSVATSASNTLKNCLRNLAQTQINRLNADYNATNTDISNWASVASIYPMVSGVGSMDVQFVLATQNHPSGTGIPNGTVAVTFGTDFLNGADQDLTWAGYMNLVVRDEGQGILGYSPLGGSPSAGQTVVINRFCFGSGSGCTGYNPTAPFNLGRTLTHELGHFFNLDHTFVSCGSSNQNLCASSGDRVCDTPAVNVETYECPTPGSINGCFSGQKSLTMNYMDYVDDACMYMFTPGQTNRMLAYYNTIIDEFVTEALSNTDLVRNNYTLSPNPNNGSFTIQFKDLSTDYAIEIFDISGRVVFEDYYTQSSNLTQNITIQNPSAGVYFVNVKSGAVVDTQKIIIR